MMLIVIAAILFHFAQGASIMDFCPDSCTCELKEEQLTTTCTNFEFIKRLTAKQKMNIVRLNINQASNLNAIDMKLKHLKNLQVLDLSNNTIKSVPKEFPYLPKLRELNLSNNQLNALMFSQVPKNLNQIDLSFNHLTHFPKDWSTLKHLEVVNFTANPIHCDCDNLAVYQESKLLIKGNLSCFSPPEFLGKPLDSINCSLSGENFLNFMLGDEAGSTADNPNLEEEEEYIKADEIQVQENENIEEGSGDEGSGFEPVLPCHFNCSTPRPVGMGDDKDALPPPKFPDQVKMIFEDIIQPERVTTTEIVEIPEKEEPIVVKESDKHQVETISNVTDDGTLHKLERASLESDNSKSVYIVIGLAAAFMILLAIYYVNKKKNLKKKNRKRNKSNENGFGEEMKPLGKSSEPVVDGTKSPIVEVAPLLNGQNGKIKEDEEDEQPERVTIKAGEIVDAIPKTPVVVHRQINNNGEIVITTKPLA